MLRSISVSAAAVLLVSCGGPPPGNPAFFNEPDLRLPREQAAIVYPADQGGQCAEFRVVAVDGVAKRRMTPGAFQLSPGRHELVLHKDGNAGTLPVGGDTDVFFLELLNMAPAMPICTAISHDMCLRFDATLEAGRSYRVRVEGEETYRLVDWQSGRSVATAKILARRQPGGKPLNCGAMMAAPGPALYSPVVAAPESVPAGPGRIVPAAAPRALPATAGPTRIVPDAAPAQPVPAASATSTGGPRQLLPGAAPTPSVPASPAPAADGPQRLIPAAQQELLTW